MSNKKTDPFHLENANVAERMQLFLDLCAELETLLEQTWLKLILGDIKDAMQLLADLFTCLDKLLYEAEFLNNYEFIQINPAQILARVSALESALSVPDYILTADILKYEIKPVIIDWRKNIKTAVKRVKRLEYYH